jgi:hypothetical protein
MPWVTKVERRASLHLDRRAPMVGEHEDRVVVGRILPPPPLPVFVPPLVPHRTEHVAAHHGGADAGEARGHRVVVDAGGAARLADHGPPGARLEHPLVQARTADTEWVLQILIGTGDVPVERHRHRVDS